MYESYTRQALPSKAYRELIGSAICVFNSNNAFIIENILRADETGKYEWHKLIDKVSGHLLNDIKNTITAESNNDIAELFDDLVKIRNRIVHSFQVTAPDSMTDNQLLATKYKDGTQKYIDKEFLLDFIRKNEDLSLKLDNFRK